ncbi:hypothetical protein EQH64_13545 [Escherichia coli]|nr:hypothetical protein EQH64_13545 [Escherichia coli]
MSCRQYSGQQWVKSDSSHCPLLVTTAGSARSFPGGAKLLLPSGSSGISPQWTFPTGDAHHVTGQLSGGRRKSF